MKLAISVAVAVLVASGAAGAQTSKSADKHGSHAHVAKYARHPLVRYPDAGPSPVGLNAGYRRGPDNHADDADDAMLRAMMPPGSDIEHLSSNGGGGR